MALASSKIASGPPKSPHRLKDSKRGATPFAGSSATTWRRFWREQGGDRRVDYIRSVHSKDYGIRNRLDIPPPSRGLAEIVHDVLRGDEERIMSRDDWTPNTPGESAKCRIESAMIPARQ